MRIVFFIVLLCWAHASPAIAQVPDRARRIESDELFPIRQNGKWGYMDKTGKVVIEPQFLLITSRDYHFNPGWSEGLAPVRFNNGLWGYIDKTGRTVIGPRFTLAARFNGGLAAVIFKNDDRVAYINTTGETIIPPKYCYRGDFSDFADGFAYVELVEGCAYFSHDRIDRRTEYGYIDKTGKLIISKLGYGWFSEGLAPVRVKGKHGFIDRQGKMIIEPKFESAHSFFQGLAFVRVGKKVVYIDKTGRIVIDPPKGYWITCCNYSEGLTTVISKDGKYGYVDKTGKIVIRPRFDGAEEFSEGLAAANIGADRDYTGGKWGYIDKTGKIVIKMKFGHAEPFRGGLALVGDSFLGTVGYIDKTGKYIREPAK